MRYIRLTCFTFLIIFLWLAAIFLISRSAHSSPEGVTSKTLTSFPRSESLHNFPVVKKGVHTFEEVRTLQKNGRYPDIDAASLHVVVVDRGFLAYSQYFRKGKMFWTRHKTFVKAGTILYCDKNGTCINTECGNELSLVPQQPTDLALEPILDEPTAPTPPRTSLLLPPPSSPTPPESQPPVVSQPPFEPPFEPPYYPPVIGTPCCGGQPPLKVAEPSALGLMLVGFAMIFGFRKIHK